jgi:hypothetical protein
MKKIMLIIVILLNVSTNSFTEECRFKSPVMVVHGGGGTDCNGITWMARNIEKEKEFNRKISGNYVCDGNGYIEENHAYCFYPVIAEQTLVVYSGCLDQLKFINTDLGCDDYTETYKKLMKDKRRLKSICYEYNIEECFNK